jgi:hypothetical protein
MTSTMRACPRGSTVAFRRVKWPSGPTAASRARTKPRNGASSRHYERTDLPHVFRTATRKPSVTAGHTKTAPDQVCAGQGPFSLIKAVGRGGVEPPTFRFSGVTNALLAVPVPR